MLLHIQLAKGKKENNLILPSIPNQEYKHVKELGPFLREFISSLSYFNSKTYLKKQTFLLIPQLKWH